MQIGEKLKGLRESLGLSQIELAKITGIPNQNISKYENNERQPDYDTLLVLVRFFEISVDYLFSFPYGFEKSQEIMGKMEKYNQFFHEILLASDKKIEMLIKQWELIKQYVNGNGSGEK